MQYFIKEYSEVLAGVCCLPGDNHDGEIDKNTRNQSNNHLNGTFVNWIEERATKSL